MQEVAKKLMNYAEFAAEAERARQLRIDELSAQKEGSKSTTNQLCGKSRTSRQGNFLE